MKDKEYATKEECEQELERLNKAFADWYQKHSAEINPNAGTNGASEQATPDAGTTESTDGDQPEEVIDAD